jgi:radical SAM/Cys-rich protein
MEYEETDVENLVHAITRWPGGYLEGLIGRPESQRPCTASLPCFTAETVDAQSGRDVFEASLRALQRLNALGYGRSGSELVLNLVYNPLGASLPPPQTALERDYKRELAARFGIEFHRLFTITNMPIKRFADGLARTGKHEQYMSLLVNHFNPDTVQHVMSRSLVSVGWDGRLYDCDFNQMLEMPMPGMHSMWAIESVSGLAGRGIATGAHCFGCTAGAGSSCGGSLS